MKFYLFYFTLVYRFSIMTLSNQNLIFAWSGKLKDFSQITNGKTTL